MERSLIYKISLAVVVLGAFSIIVFFGKHMTKLVDLATTISFLIAPVIAFVNFRLVTGRHIPIEAQPGTFMRILSWAGIIFLTGFAVVYILI